jgi:hypothetical protein
MPQAYYVLIFNKYSLVATNTTQKKQFQTTQLNDQIFRVRA